MARIKTKFITANAVTNPKLAQMAAHTYKGNNTGSTADAADITNTQLTADLNVFSSSLKGLAPASGGGTTNFLRADGTWTTAGGGGLSDWTINAQTGTTYTFALTDRMSQNALVTFNNASQVLVTVPNNSSVAFPIGSQINFIQTGAGQVIVTPDTGVTINSRSGFVAPLAQYSILELVKTATNTWVLGLDLGSSFIVATGGNSVATDGNFKVHTFTSSGTFQITSGYGPVDSLVIAGGGGGAGGDSGGGGGAGGVLYTTGAGMSAGSYTVTIGAGGAAGGVSGDASNGSNSVFGSLTAIGGGGGGGNDSGTNGRNGLAGGSGGGGGGTNSSHGSGGAGTAGQGNNGGAGVTANPFAAGGGGGAGAVGGTPSGGGAVGNGGNGVSNSITGTAVTYGGGGGGGNEGSTDSSGGTGGGGRGASSGGAGGGTPVAGTANTGGGGGGYYTNGGSGQGAAGGSGKVIIRYKFQ